MRIIDNRYKIHSFITKQSYSESYLANDLLEGSAQKNLFLYDFPHNEDLINYIIDNAAYIISIKHKNILQNKSFNLVKSIDSRDINMNLYYSIVEYFDGQRLSDIKDELTIDNRLKVILDLIRTIDYLHFRGIPYGYIEPEHILVSKDIDIKLSDLISRIESRFKNGYCQICNLAISPECIDHFTSHDIIVEYHSIGDLISFLFLDEAENLIDEEGKKFFKGIINKLNNFSNRDATNLNIISHEIISYFKLEYEHDYVEERSKLFNNRFIGRKKELEFIDSLNDAFLSRSINYGALILTGDYGTGKTVFLKEVVRRFRLRNRSIYYAEMISGEGSLSGLISIFKEIVNNSSIALINSYQAELTSILPKVNLLSHLSTSIKEERIERNKIYNEITDFLIRLSNTKPLYLVFDNINNADFEFLSLLDYFFNRFVNSNIFIILSYDKKQINYVDSIEESIYRWEEESYVGKLHLNEYSLEDLTDMLQNVLGLSYKPTKTSTKIYELGRGNPKYIEYIINHLYKSGDLYIDKEGHWYLKDKDFSEIPFPVNVGEAFLNQLNMVRANYYCLASYLSACDQSMDRDALSLMLDMEDFDLDRQLEELLGLNILNTRIIDGEKSYYIQSFELKENLYNILSKDEKISIHGKISSYLLSKGRELIDSNLDSLIDHLKKANLKAEALDIVYEEANRIEDKFDAKAKYLWTLAYELSMGKESKRRLLILDKLLDIVIVKGDTDMVPTYMEEYIKLSRSLDEFSFEIKGKSHLVDIFHTERKLDIVGEYIAYIERESKKRNYIKGQIFVLVAKARLLFEEAIYEKSDELLKKAEVISLEEDIRDYLPIIYNRLGNNAYFRSRYDDAHEYYLKSISSSEAIGDVIEITKPLNNLGNLYADIYDDLDKANEYYNRGLNLCKLSGHIEISALFLTNLSENYKEQHRYDIALEYLNQARAYSKSLQDIAMEFFTLTNIGTLYLKQGNYKKSHETIEELKFIFDAEENLTFDTIGPYYDLLSLFYGNIGDMERALGFTDKAIEIYGEYDYRNLLTLKARRIMYRYLLDRKLDKEPMEDLRRDYGETLFIRDRKNALYYFTFMAQINNDMGYAGEILKEIESLPQKKKLSSERLLREIVEIHFESDPARHVDLFIKLQKNYEHELFPALRMVTNKVIAYKYYYELGDNKEALKYLFNAIDCAYKTIRGLDNEDFQYSFLKLANIAGMQDKISDIIAKEYGREISFPEFNRSNIKSFTKKIDIAPLIDAMGEDEFQSTIYADLYRSALSINNVEDLIVNMTDNFCLNVDIMLKFFAKISLAEKGQIVYIDDDNNHRVISSLNNRTDVAVNGGLSSFIKNSEGLLMNEKDSHDNELFKIYNLYEHDIESLIILPIRANMEQKSFYEEKRQRSYDGRETEGYIYLETSNVFNRFDKESYDTIKKLTPLLHIYFKNEKHRVLATTDRLTGTFTRKYYEEELTNLINSMRYQNGVFSLLMLDIDRFKNINDQYGHKQGDLVLAELGDIMRSSVRRTDIIGRYGGEEFIIILKDTGAKAAFKLAEKIREKVEKYRFSNIDNSITISIGLAAFPEHSNFKDDLMDKADQALYHAKNLGRNKTVLWSNDIGNISRRIDRLTGILVGNIEEDNRNTLALIDSTELIKEDTPLEDKLLKFLNIVDRTLEVENSILIVKDMSNNKNKAYSSKDSNLVIDENYNRDIVDGVFAKGKGEILIDWENTAEFEGFSAINNWQSIMAIPLIYKGIIKAVLYVSSPLTKGELSLEQYNLAKYLSSTFVSNL